MRVMLLCRSELTRAVSWCRERPTRKESRRRGIGQPGGSRWVRVGPGEGTEYGGPGYRAEPAGGEQTDGLDTEMRETETGD